MNLKLSKGEVLLKELKIGSSLEGFMRIKETGKDIGNSIFRDKDKLKEYLLCIDEVLCNCIYHAYKGELGNINVKFYDDEDYLRVSVRDYGSGIPIKYTKEIPGLSDNLLSESGRGLVIVNSMCDKLLIKRNENSGTEVIIYFKKGW
ncbi:ATP-binding protein [Wukongibacter sp. M2B1]|uniref:ATP-binding protein n=1 Tax=Wukongibacter sp. M2B1 TaxID=3088895 RepID=UPI003D79658C